MMCENKLRGLNWADFIYSKRHDLLVVSQIPCTFFRQQKLHAPASLDESIFNALAWTRKNCRWLSLGFLPRDHDSSFVLRAAASLLLHFHKHRGSSLTERRSSGAC